MISLISELIRNGLPAAATNPRLASLLVVLLVFPLPGCRRTAAIASSSPDSAYQQDCFRERNLESELRDASAEQMSFADAIQTHARESDEISARIASDSQGLNELETKKRAYMQEHSTAVAAIIAGAASTDVLGERQTSDEAKQVSAGVAVIVLLWAATHPDELKAVVQTLEAARDSRLSLQQDMQQADVERDAKQRIIDDLKLKEGTARQKASLLRTSLSGLSCGQKT